MSEVILPRRGRGALSAAKQDEHDEAMRQFARDIREIASRTDFSMSARGWGYYLEGLGSIDKGDINLVERTINNCRKDGTLPMDITAPDSKREWSNVGWVDGDIESEAESIIGYVENAHMSYKPFSFWDDKDTYVQMAVEKTDLKSLFTKVCSRYHIPIANVSGWADLNVRAEMMERFAEKEREGKKVVLLYFGDFDPGGLRISDHLKSNMMDLAGAVGWEPTSLYVDRFGLDVTYIENPEHPLVWIENLITGSGKNLASTSHPQHKEEWVQDYLANYGARKVEANALLADPEAGRELCRQAILQYLPGDAPERYREALAPVREELRVRIVEALRERGH